MLVRKRPIVVSGIIERRDRFVLICRPRVQPGALEAHWEFVSGLARPRESPEAAMRRTAVERTGIHVEIMVGQPPLVGPYQGRDCEFRFFLCGIKHGEGRAIDYQELRWVAKGQLCEYEFAEPTRQVVAWLAEPS